MKNILIIDDCKEILSFFEQFAGTKFDNIYTASTPIEAVSILCDYEITHIVCDWDLGKNNSTGEYLVSAWRRTFENLEKCVIWTGSNLLQVQPLPGVDAIVSKTAPFSVLLSELSE